jgi:epsilon-lactone hydrolase
LLTAIFMRPVLATQTVFGLVINRFRPDAMQQARLDVINKPLRVVPALPGTEVASVALPQCPAEWVVAPAARESGRVIVLFPRLGPGDPRA